MSPETTANDRRNRVLPIITCTLSIVALLVAGTIIFDRNDAEQPEAQAPPRTRRDRPESPQLTTAGIFFNLSQATIPPEDILPGGPGKDGIPAITDPKMVPADEANYLVSADRVVGVVFDGIARAYPLCILYQHEVVNDTVGSQPVVITYCPLCDSALAFDRRDGDQIREFGVSGLLYNSNVLMYDRGEEESLWSQMMRQSVSGDDARTKLPMLPLDLTTGGEWLSRHPDTQVMSNQTGFGRDYDRNPYAGYFSNDQLMFPINETSDRLPAKTPVLGIIVGSQARAYPVTAFNESHRTIEDQLGAGSFEIAFDPQANSLRVIRADPDVRWAYAYWFAWYGFHTDTEVYAP